MRKNSVPCSAQVFLCVAFLCLMQPLSTHAALDPEEALRVWQHADEQKLWDHPEWWVIGHYYRTIFGRVKSRMDDPRFFLHEDGKTDRRLELKATLMAFLTGDVSEEEERTVACRFPARREWLARRLDLPEEWFAEGDCEDFHRAIEHLGITSAAVVYPAGYLNSPASMFGHLLLVLDRDGKDRLLSRAVNYAAVVEDTFGPLFAFKGIFGLYDGVFAILPYYQKVEEYSAVNKRDIWEYPLDFSPEELDRFLRHIWELQELRSRYYFFKENCAFNLLYPIEVARPELDLVRRFRLSSIPVHLLQQLVDAGVTGEVVYRPSKTSRMRHFSSELSDEQTHRVRELQAGVPPDETDGVEELSLAIEWVQFLYTEREITPEDYRERVFPLLRARSRLGQQLDAIPPVPDPPHEGHAPRRIAGGLGKETTRGEWLTSVQLRPAYHDDLDAPAGYPLGSSIRMFEFEITHNLETDKTYLREFRLVDIRSQTPPEVWVRPLSWAGAAYVEADPFQTEQHRGILRFSTGATVRAGENGFAYLMMSQLLRVDQNLSDTVGWEPGGEWGAVHARPALRFSLRGRHHWGVLGSADVRHEVEAEIRFPLGGANSLGFSSRQLWERGEIRNTVFATVLRTF